MPLNTLRLNHAPSSHPNERIVFIKPLKTYPDHTHADLFLRAIAAQCLPIMKTHYLSITTLEEHEPNKEFIGRNFNNGEIIQLVLRGHSGGWLPFRAVQMVMMHELAHNTHMNHGKGFWKVRNEYAGMMQGLFARGYTGEGLWGRGQTVRSLEEGLGGMLIRSEELAELPVCGGTFRSRGRKRKRRGGGEDLTWREKRDRRIEKKFGKKGQALGEDEETRLMLEVSKKGSIGGKPRVAGSKRGRELRAAAALARFGTNNIKSEYEVKNEEETESEDEYEDDAGEDAVGTDGRKILDGKGNAMVKVCEDEDADDTFVKQEMDEMNLYSFDSAIRQPESPASTTESEKSSIMPLHERKPPNQDQGFEEGFSAPTKDTEASSPDLPAEVVTTDNASKPELTCPICTTTNSRSNPTCITCAHVLDKRKDPRSWPCTSTSCSDLGYLNAGDAGVCGLYGRSRK